MHLRAIQDIRNVEHQHRLGHWLGSDLEKEPGDEQRLMTEVGAGSAHGSMGGAGGLEKLAMGRSVEFRGLDTSLGKFLVGKTGEDR